LLKVRLIFWKAIWPNQCLPCKRKAVCVITQQHQNGQSYKKTDRLIRACHQSYQ